MADAFTTFGGYYKPEVGASDDTWGTKLNTNFTLLDKAIHGVEAVSVSNVDVTLTDLDGVDSQARAHGFQFTGTLLANVKVIIPAGAGRKTYVVRNLTSGAFTLTMTAGVDSASVVIPQDSKSYIVHKYGDDHVQRVQIVKGALLDVAQSWTAAQTMTPVALTDAATVAVNAALSNSFTLSLTGNHTLGNPTNINDGQVFDVLVTNTGSFTLSYGTTYRAPAGAFPVVTTGATKASLLTFRRAGAFTMLIGAVLDFTLA